MEVITEEYIIQKSSQELTALLYEGLISCFEEALIQIGQKDMVGANKSLQRANDLLYRLGSGLRYEAGPIAENLDSLYNYIASVTIQANLRKDAEQIKHVKELTETIASAWKAALDKKEKGAARSVMQKVSAYESHVMRTKI